jgi:hypothetical protein
MEGRRYYLGGGLAGRWWAGGLTKRDVGLGAAGLLVAVVLAVAGLALAEVVVVVVTGVLIGGLRMADAGGADAGARLGGWAARWLVARAGVNGHRAGEGWSRSMGRMRVLAVEAGEAELGLVELAAGRGRRWLVGVFVLAGETLGLADDAVEERACSRLGSFLNRLADHRLPVDQVDFVTRVCPARAADGSGVAGPAAAMVEGLEELAAAQATETRHWLVVRMPVDGLLERSARLSGAGGDSVVAAAFATMGEVARAAEDGEFAPAWALTPAGWAGLVRCWFDCDRAPEEALGSDRLSDAVPSFEVAAGGAAVRASGLVSDWWHSALVVPVAGWPSTPVDARFMHRLVVSVRPDTVRTVVVQFPLLPRRLAVKRARTVTAAALAAVSRATRRGEVTEGGETVRANAGAWLLEDMAEHGAAGVTPQLRVLVSARDRRGLLDARAEAEFTLDLMGFNEVAWLDGDQSRGLAATLPVAMGTRETRR